MAIEKMEVIEHHKLVRDLIPDRMIADGKIPVSRILTDNQEYVEAMLAKLQEEVNELALAVRGGASPEKIVEESIDVKEITEAIEQHFGISEPRSRVVQQAKARENGRFVKKIFLEEERIKNGKS